MVSLPVLALVLSIIAVALAVGATIAVVDVRARVQSYESSRQGRLEGQATEGSSRPFTRDGPGVTTPSYPGDKSVSGRFQSVPEVTPTGIAPGLKSPPRVKGGFGSQATDATQLPTDDKTS